MLNALAIRFGNDSPPKIPLVDTTQLPVFSDNVIPSMLVHFGILEIGSANLPNLREAFGAPEVTENLNYVPPTGERKKASIVESEMAQGPELSMEEAYVMRAAALDACEMIVQEAKGISTKPDQAALMSSVDLPGIDGWLWSVAKEGRMRSKLSRFRQAGICVMY